ncbi:DUF4266 domain-containing protein [Undibacterium sp. RuTC16W]|uniref:DUF4266 domain-containing protein n=1 Tax=Undibacterium sp. RuTC16W TaxID=3413048 RepID=UPI003BF0644B
MMSSPFLCRRTHYLNVGLLLLLMQSLSACSSLPSVQAWEKGKLAKQEMKFEGDPLETKFVEHVYFSKEAASGGAGVGGGGCGCN